MLVLKLRIGSSFRIGTETVVTVRAAANSDVCLSVNCPLGVTALTAAEANLRQALKDTGESWDPAGMHLLSSRPKPELFIGPDVRVLVLSVSGTSVTLGIAAPESLTVQRITSLEVSV